MMVSFFTNTYTISCQNGALPETYQHAATHAQRIDRFMDEGGTPCFLSVAHGKNWPFLIVVQTYAPAGYGWYPGVLLIPETDILFFGAGERVLAYNLQTVQQLWIDTADTGFYRWARHQDVVVMAAELELAAWTLEGQKLWSQFVEPPWDYDVENGRVLLDVMGITSTFDLRRGPEWKNT